MANGKVLIVMGSDSDFPIMEKCFKMLDKFDVKYDVKVASAHRTPDKAIALARSAEDSGYDVIIGAAGLAAHLSGVLAANTILPVIGVPCKGGALNGVDALYATVQMPTGIPVATVAIDGGANSAILACQMIALKSEELRKRLHDYKKELADSVEEKDKALQTKIAQM
ncbi:MAG: 5-(carboxyamino)imidazole ribonucleotide mutase [Saccharofermentans sp.]|jgi:5-(carboxyamino)imidazole ribonucleotide mutase|nr:5-(carboxyamino)imidazole ribonucleotide mutase [Mageeibacillus sp.]MCI1264900.1 5-(carboxyamino)imidazole ribonucleotide mutase [Saccharofermentans sp.]MCI1275819.1 5-(carboxyamino)imidazole ribonucleotide mutase [Saccharofermentans sp.]